MSNQTVTDLDIDPLPTVEAFNLIMSAAEPASITGLFSFGQMLALLLALACLLLSGFVSGSELAFFSLTDEQLEELEDEPGGDRTIKLLENPERLLAQFS